MLKSQTIIAARPKDHFVSHWQLVLRTLFNQSESQELRACRISGAYMSQLGGDQSCQDNLEHIIRSSIVSVLVQIKVKSIVDLRKTVGSVHINRAGYYLSMGFKVIKAIFSLRLSHTQCIHDHDLLQRNQRSFIEPLLRLLNISTFISFFQFTY